MTTLLRAELLKLRTTRTFAALAGAAIGTSLLLATLVSLLTEPERESVLIDVFASDTSAVFIVVLAIVGISGEWRHRTIASALLAAPDRLRFLAAKTLAFAAAGSALSLAVAIAVAVAGFAILSARDLPTPDVDEWAAQVVRLALMAALGGAFGVALGALVRNQVIAVVGVLMASFAVEPVLISLVPEVGRFGPFVALPTAAADIPAADAGLGDVALLSPVLATLVLLAWIGAAFAAAVVLLRRRDVE